MYLSAQPANLYQPLINLYTNCPPTNQSSHYPQWQNPCGNIPSTRNHDYQTTKSPSNIPNPPIHYSTSIFHQPTNRPALPIAVNPKEQRNDTIRMKSAFSTNVALNEQVSPALYKSPFCALPLNSGVPPLSMREPSTIPIAHLDQFFHTVHLTVRRPQVTQRG